MGSWQLQSRDLTLPEGRSCQLVELTWAWPGGGQEPWWSWVGVLLLVPGQGVQQQQAHCVHWATLLRLLLLHLPLRALTALLTCARASLGLRGSQSCPGAELRARSETGAHGPGPAAPVQQAADGASPGPRPSTEGLPPVPPRGEATGVPHSSGAAEDAGLREQAAFGNSRGAQAQAQGQSQAGQVWRRRRFTPWQRVEAAVITEHVTPWRCYFALQLLQRQDAAAAVGGRAPVPPDPIPVFEGVEPPLKHLCQLRASIQQALRQEAQKEGGS